MEVKNGISTTKYLVKLASEALAGEKTSEDIANEYHVDERIVKELRKQLTLYIEEIFPGLVKSHSEKQ